MTIPAVVRAYAAAHGFSVHDPKNKRFVDPDRRQVLRLAFVISRSPAVVWLHDSSRGMIQFGQERPKCRPRELPMSWVPGLRRRLK